MLISCSYERSLYGHSFNPLKTIPFISFPTLKKGSFFGFTSTFSTVLGFLSEYDSYSLTEKLPNPLISTLSPFFIVPVKPLKTRLMMSVAYFSVSFSLAASTATMFDFVMVIFSVNCLIILIFMNDMTMSMDMSIEIEI